MKHLAILVLPLALTMFAVGCDEAKGPAYAFGQGQIFPPDYSGQMNGSLGTSGSQDLYGFCKYKDGSFSFEVGHSDLTHLTSAPVKEPMYFKFSGITGPDGGDPVEGVFTEETDADGNPKVKAGAEYESTFENATVKAQETFSFPGTAGNCRVALFAESAQGELVPSFNKSFEYYVEINCNGMESVKGNLGTSLQIIRLSFYFDNCS